MIQEWRIYEATSGKLAALHNHLKVAAGLFEKHGLNTLGFWTEEIGTAFQIAYMWSYEDLQERQTKLAAFTADDAWKQLVAAEREKEGPVVARIRNTMLEKTRYSPEPRITGNVQEWRIYDSVPGKLPDLNNSFADHAVGLFAKHGISSIGYWTEMFGTSNRLVYMLGYPSLGDREKSWAAFQADPAWQEARADSEKNGPLVAKVSSCILRATSFSPKG
jgi:hypothetical protein